jgi:hypothetical protein
LGRLVGPRKKKTWEECYREDPSLLLPETENQAYLKILENILRELEEDPNKESEEWRNYWDEASRRVTMAGGEFH